LITKSEVLRHFCGIQAIDVGHPHHFAVHHPRLLVNGIAGELTLQIHFDFLEDAAL
jgi:hypothetical protein